MRLPHESTDRPSAAPTRETSQPRASPRRAFRAPSPVPSRVLSVTPPSFPTGIPHLWVPSPRTCSSPHATSRTRIPRAPAREWTRGAGYGQIVSMSAGVDTSLSVFVSAPRVDASVAGDGRACQPQGGEFALAWGALRLGGEGRDAARGLHPLLFRVEAEGIVRVPAPGVQRAAPRDDGGVAAAARMGLVGCVESRRATRSPSGRASAVGVGTDQSSAHLLEVTGAKSRPS